MHDVMFGMCCVMSMNSLYHKRQSRPDCHGMHIVRSGTQNFVVTHNSVCHYFLVTFLSEFVACVHSKGLRELQKYRYDPKISPRCTYNSISAHSIRTLNSKHLLAMGIACFLRYHRQLSEKYNTFVTF